MNKTSDEDTKLKTSSSRPALLRGLRRRLSALGLLLALSAWLPASARADTSSLTGKVITLTADWMPFLVGFVHSGLTANCSQNQLYPNTNWVSWSFANPDQAKATYAALLSAYLTQSNVFIVVDTTTCAVSAVRLTQ
jgi:hypothetical protein